jgi:sensor domain CHASE-containing protein
VPLEIETDIRFNLFRVKRLIERWQRPGERRSNNLQWLRWRQSSQPLVATSSGSLQDIKTKPGTFML